MLGTHLEVSGLGSFIGAWPRFDRVRGDKFAAVHEQKKSFFSGESTCC